MKIALVHDWLNQIGGAENVLETLVDMFPDAPVHTSMYARKIMPEAYQAWDIRTSFMQRLPGVTSHHQAYLPFYPMAFEQFDLGGYDVVLSNKSAFCRMACCGRCWPGCASGIGWPPTASTSLSPSAELCRRVFGSITVALAR